MVLGETQILGQVREAYEPSRELRAAGALLNPLFQRAIAVGKQVMHETPLPKGRLSVASVAVDYAGGSSTTSTTRRCSASARARWPRWSCRISRACRRGRLLVCNRDPAKAEALAAQFKGEAVPFERLDDHLVAADIVITSTGSPHPIITRKPVPAPAAAPAATARCS